MYVPHVKMALILVLVFLCSFAVLQWAQGIAPHIYGIEGYYHMGVARLIRAEGIPHDFPWMQFSIFSRGYADLELLHHLALAPFAGNGEPEVLEARAKTAAALFGAALLTLLLHLLRRFRCPGAYFWCAALVCGAGGFLFRLAQPQPEVLSLFLLLLAVPVFARRQRRYWPHVLLGLLFTLTGPAPYLFVGMAFLFHLGRRMTGEQSLDWRMLVYSLAGTAAGILLHPDRWDFARLLALLNWRILLSGLVAGSGVPVPIQAVESKAPGLDALLLHNELVVLPLAFLLIALLVRRRQAPVISAETVSLFLCSLSALGLTMAAARYTLFWALFTTLFSALLLRDLLAGKDDPPPPARQWRRIAVPALIILAVAGVRTHDYFSDRLLAEWTKAAPPEMRDVCAILDSTASAGDVVFHTRWIHFPQLFFFAPRQYYLVGSDPMLMLAHGEQYLDIWQNLRAGKLTDPYPFVRGLFNSRHLVASKNQERLLRRLGRDPRFIRVYQGRSLVLFSLRDSDPRFVTSWEVAPLAEGAVAGQESIFDLPADDLPRSPYHRSSPPGGIGVGYVDFRPFFPLGGMAPPAALAETVLQLDHAVTGAEILFGSSGPFQLELNGELVLANRDAGRMALIDQWRCPVNLQAGENRLRLIAARTSEDWGFFLRVVDEAGRPIQFDRP